MTDLIIERNMQKKAAGQSTQPTFQQQFGILSNAIILDKFPALSDYRVAFQLVDKNDENTKALGVSINKLNNEFIEIPAFFHNGKIKTGDIMYVPSIDMFRPVSDAWLADVRSMNLDQSGKELQRQSVTGAVSPAGIRVKESTDPIIKTASQQQDVDVFSTAIKMGKEACLTMMNNLQNPVYFNNTLKFYSGDRIADFVKEAQQLFQDKEEVPAYTVVTPMDKQALQLDDQQKEILYRDGYYLVKNAAKLDIGDASQVLKMNAVSNAANEFCTVTQSCKCTVPDMNGDLHDVIVIVPTAKISSECLCCRQLPSSNQHVFIVDGNKLIEQSSVIANSATIDHSKDGFTKAGKTLTGSVQVIPSDAVIVCPNGETILVQRQLVYYDKAGNWSGYEGTSLSIDDTGLQKPVLNTKRVVLPQGSRIILPQNVNQDGTWKQNPKRVGPASVAYVSTPAQLNAILTKLQGKNYRKVKVYTDGSQIQISSDDNTKGRMGSKEAALHLVQTFNVSPADARQMLNSTLIGATYNSPKSQTFLVKKAAVQEPDWTPSNIGKTDISNTGPRIDQKQMAAFQQDPSKLMQDIQAATDAGVKQVFDVSTIKLLAQSTDISQHISDFIADFLKALDKLCRMLFMLYWHGDVMEQKYGKMKLKSLQQSVKNSMDSLSQLTVFLKMRGFGGVNGDSYVSANRLIGGEML